MEIDERTNHNKLISSSIETGEHPSHRLIKLGFKNGHNITIGLSKYMNEEEIALTLIKASTDWIKEINKRK